MSTSPSPQLAQYSVDWNQVALQAITAGLDEIPVVGTILSHIVFAFWPPTGQDVWAEIKQKVEALINSAISTADYQRVAAQLGSAQQDSGLIGELNSYLGSVSTTNNNGQDPKMTWTAANGVFINAQSVFQQTGIEVLLLPLFAQFANMHLSLLRDGVIQKFANVSELQARIKDYTAWATQWFGSGQADRIKANQAFNYVNDYNREMQLGVMNFQETWAYFDPTAYPPPVKNLVFDSPIYYSVTGVLNAGQSGNYQLTTPPAGAISNVNVIWEEDMDDNYNIVMGTELTYPSGQTPYNGVLLNGQVPPVGTVNPDYYAWYANSFAVGPTNPIVAVSGVYESTGGVYCVDFGFKDGSSTGQIPNQTGQDYPTSYSINPPTGYYLNSIWIPPAAGWYDSAPDIVFGFLLEPTDLDQATAHALYVSSLAPASHNPALAKYADTAAAENWESERQQFLSSLARPKA